MDWVSVTLGAVPTAVAWLIEHLSRRREMAGLRAKLDKQSAELREGHREIRELLMSTAERRQPTALPSHRRKRAVMRQPWKDLLDAGIAPTTDGMYRKWRRELGPIYEATSPRALAGGGRRLEPPTGGFSG